MLRVDHRVDQNPRHTFRKRGVFYFSRRVPKGLQGQFERARVVTCLHTRSAEKAGRSAVVLSMRLEAVWAQMRIEDILPSRSEPSPEARSVPANGNEPGVGIAEAGGLYRRLKAGGKGKGFEVYTTRHIAYAVECLGSVSIAGLRRTDAGRFRDHLIAKSLTTSSIKRVFATVRAAVNLAISEYGLECANSFAGTFIPEVGTKTVRKPIPVPVIRSVQTACLKADDDRRLLLALISDTGLRLAEALGLSRTDLKLRGPVPHLDVRPHPWRGLKTASSTRTVPLVGASLLAARRLAETTDSMLLFPRYASQLDVNSNSASAALNKWLRPRLPAGCVIHSFRHSLRDRLRAAECPADIVDAIGGWTTHGVGHRYGTGYSLEVKERWLKLITL